MALLIAGLVLFLGIHFLPTIPAWRNAAVTRLGEQRYKGAFSLVVMAAHRVLFGVRVVPFSV